MGNDDKTIKTHGLEQPFSDMQDRAEVLGVSGRWTHRTIKPGRPVTLFFKQIFKTDARPIKGYGEGATISAELRFDDECGNGHNTFSITADVTIPSKRKSNGYYGRVDVAGGCLHEDIARVFPELAPLIKWHLVSTDGPMHYVANTTYHASNRDHHGCLAGEPWAWNDAVRFGDNPITHKLGHKFAAFLRDAAPYDFEVIAIEYGPDSTGYKFGPKYTFGGFADRWHECPFDSEQKALGFLTALQRCSPQFLKIPSQFGEGKARNLNAARECAVWPEATDAELCADKETLTAALNARLPALIEAFKADMLRAGFMWSADQKPRITVRVTCDTGNTWVTGFNGTLAEARQYFIGQVFTKENPETGEETRETGTAVALV